MMYSINDMYTSFNIQYGDLNYEILSKFGCMFYPQGPVVDVEPDIALLFTQLINAHSNCVI